MLIWALGASGRLRAEAQNALEEPGNEVVVSAVSVWEVAIKIANGKLTLPKDLREGLDQVGFERLEITVDHALAAGALPRHHRDPFDRMLIAQAQLEGRTIVTSDRAFAAYGVAVLPA